MATKIDVDLIRLKNDYDSCVEKIEDAKNKMVSVDNSVQEMGGMWKGPAHDAFFEQFELDHNFYNFYSNMLKRASDLLEESRKIYIACETKNVDLANSLPTIG